MVAMETASPLEAIERVLYLAPKVHIYAIPPMTSTKGHIAASWTKEPGHEIFTARLRIIESSASVHASTALSKITTSLLLEAPTTGELFAAAPYTSPNVVETALDSSRFFAIRVEGEDGRKAVLGMGFEERSDAFDFGVALQEVRKVLGMDLLVSATSGKEPLGKGRQKLEPVALEKSNWGLKEGEMLHVDIGGKGMRQKEQGGKEKKYIEPPSGGFIDFSLLPPPPSARQAKEEMRRGEDISQNRSLGTLGFDDGEFGEFQ